MPALYSLADLKAAYQRKEKLKYSQLKSK